MSERIPGSRLLVPLLVVALSLLILRLLPLPVREMFVVIFTAVLLASAVSPAATALERYRLPRGVTVLLIYLAGVLVVVGVVALMAKPISGEVDSLTDKLPQYDEDLRSAIGRFSPELAERYSRDKLIDQGVNQLEKGVNRATGYAVTLSSVFVRLIIVLVMAYFMAVEADFSERVVVRFAPPEYRLRVHSLLSTIGNRLGHWARAQLLLALFFGLAFGLGLRVAGVPYATTLGVFGGVVETIPYIGGFVTLVLALLIAATKSPWLLIWVAAWYTVVVQVQAHVLAPVLMHRVVGMHPVVVVIALFVGVESLGFFGALLAVPIAVVLQALLDEFYAFPSTGSTITALRSSTPAEATSRQPEEEPDLARRSGP